MPIVVACLCGKKYQAPDHAAGKHIRCKVCQELIAVPSTEASPQSLPLPKPQPPAVPRPSVPPGPLGAKDVDLGDAPGNAPAGYSYGNYAQPMSRGAMQPSGSRSRRGVPTWVWVLAGLFLGGGFVVVLLAVAAFIFIGSLAPTNRNANQSVASSSGGDTNSMRGGVNTTINAVRTPSNRTLPGGVRYETVRPAGGTELNIYVPPGDHSNQSLGCVLVAPAGTNLLLGSSLGNDEYHDETLPYAQAGYVAIMYSLAGNVDLENATNDQVRSAYLDFQASNGGLKNLASAIDYVLKEIPEVDPSRLYSAGHSSAGTISLMAAMREPRIAGSIAYAACTDPVNFHQDYAGVPEIRSVFPGYEAFDLAHSPMELSRFIKKPVFLFQARDDSVVSVAEARTFVDKLKSTNSQVEYIEVATGDHYDSMISQGIPAATDWLKRLEATQ